MNDAGLWRQEGPKAFLAFLASATGEDHDAVVYDTKLEFDPSNDAAVRYVASVAMTKACQGEEVFCEPMPDDGSVAPHNEEPQSPRIKVFYQERHAKENSVHLYMPDASAYSEAAIRAITHRRILAADMTEDEQAEMEQKLVEAKRSDDRYMLLHYYLPLAFAFISLILIVYKLSH